MVVIILSCIFVISNKDIKLIERRPEDVAPHCPAVVREIVVADHREKGVLDACVFLAHDVVRIAFVNKAPILVDLIVLGNITPFGLSKQRVEHDVILGLGVGNIAQVHIEQVVVVKPYLQHLVHSTRIGSQMAVGPDKKRVLAFVIHAIFIHQVGIEFVINKVLLVILFRHLHAVLNGRAGHEHTRRTHLFARAVRQQHSCQPSSNDDIFCFHNDSVLLIVIPGSTQNLYFRPNLSEPS